MMHGQTKIKSKIKFYIRGYQELSEFVVTVHECTIPNRGDG